MVMRTSQEHVKPITIFNCPPGILFSTVTHTRQTGSLSVFS